MESTTDGPSPCATVATSPASSASSAEPTVKVRSGARRSSHIWQRVVLKAFIGTERALQRLSRPAALRFGRRLGLLACQIDGKRRQYADNNLRIAYGGHLTAADRAALIRSMFAHWGMSTVEFLRGPAYDKRRMDELVSAVEGREHLETVRQAGNGFVIVTGHIGNFEFMGRWMASQGVPSTAIAREPADPDFAAYLRRMREYGGNVILPKGSSVRVLLSVLKKKGVLTLAADQNSGDLFIPFFGVPAGTVAGPALLAIRAGVPLLPAFCVWEPDDSYRIVFLPPISTAANVSGDNETSDRDANVLRVMTAASEALEEVVRRFPEQWLWMHNRWKSAFEEKNRVRWPEGYDYEALRAEWNPRNSDR